MSEEQQAQQTNPVFNIEKIYIKDLSIEVPNAPHIFLERESPQIDMQLNSQSEPIDQGIYQTALTITVTAKLQDKTVFLIEVTQAGIFRAEHIPNEALEPMLAVACPNMLFPYAREAISEASVRAGFPPVMLQPVNFESIYMQQKQAQPGGQQAN